MTNASERASGLESPERPTSGGSGPGDRPGFDHGASRDQQLVKAIARGDTSAWSTLLARHQDRLYAVCLRMVGRPDVAADLCQEAMVKIISGLHSYDATAALTTWMTRIAMNVCLTHLRSEKVRRHVSLDQPADGGRAASIGPIMNSGGQSSTGTNIAGGELSGSERVLHDEERERVGQALAILEPDQRAMLVLRDVRGLDYAQIALVLGIAEGTVKSRLFRARAALRAKLGDT